MDSLLMFPIPFPLPLNCSKGLRPFFSVLFLLFAVRAGAQTRAEAIADSLYATGDYIHAINAYSKVGNRASGLQIARAYKAVGNYDKAIKQYEALAAGNIDLQVVRFELGKLYSKTKRTHQARELFLSLSQNNADNPEYHYHLGAAYQDLGRTRESISSYKKAVALDKNPPSEPLPPGKVLRGPKGERFRP